MHAESQRISSCFPCFTRVPAFHFSSSLTLNSLPGRLLPQSSSTPTWYIARTTIDRKNAIRETPSVSPTSGGAVPVHRCRTPRSARSARARARRPQATKEFSSLGSPPVAYGFHVKPIIQPLDKFSKMTMPSIPSAVAHATASAPATIMRLYPSRFTTPPTPMIPMPLTPASACDWRISLNPTTFLDEPTQRTS